jgi:tetratricopeptide (TPR) repeat protein
VQTEAESRTADSLSKVLNAPELKEINSQILAQPASAELYDRRALIYRNLQQFEASVNDSKRAIRLDSLNNKYYMTLVDCYFMQNKTRMARELLEIMEKKFPDDIESRLKLAELFFAVRQYQNAIDYTNKALKIDENTPRAYFLKGNIYRESGDTSRAISSLQTAVEQDNTYADAFHDLGILFGAKRDPLALQYYENALRLRPGNIETLYARAMFLQSTGKYAEAEKEYRDMIARDSLCARCHYNLGAMALDVKNDMKKAVSHFSDAIRADDTYVFAYYWRGYCRARMNDRTGAREDFNRCLQIEPGFRPAIESLGAL